MSTESSSGSGTSTRRASVTYTPLNQLREVFSKISCAHARILINSHNRHASARSSNEGDLDREVLTVQSTEQPMEAFQRLIKAGVQSAPVIDNTTGKIVGLLDLKDLVSLIVLTEEDKQLTRIEHSSKPGSVASSITAATAAMKISPTTQRSRSPSPGSRGGLRSADYLPAVFASFSANTRAVAHRPQDFSVRYLAARNRCMQVKSTDSMLSVVDLLSGGADVRRVIVTSESGSIVDLFSPSDVVKLLVKLYGKFVLPGHESEKGDAACEELRQSISALNVGSTPVVTVRSDWSVLDTLRLMNANKISGIGVVDKDNKLVGNLSGSDLKHAIGNPDFVQQLSSSVGAFIANTAQSRIGTDDVSPAVCVYQSTPLLAALAKIDAAKMHRVFIADSHNKPIGVVSVEDVVKLIQRGFPSARTERTVHPITSSLITPIISSPVKQETSIQLPEEPENVDNE